MPKESKAKPSAQAAAAAPKKASRSKKDAGAPKRALSAYMFFSQDWRERIKQENPQASFGEVGRLLGAKWSSLSDSEKKPYQDMAERDKQRAETDKAAYKEAGGGKKKTSKKAAKAPEPEDDDEESD